MHPLVTKSREFKKARPTEKTRHNENKHAKFLTKEVYYVKSSALGLLVPIKHRMYELSMGYPCFDSCGKSYFQYCFFLYTVEL